MKQLKHPATIIASLALFAALAGGAGAAMTGMISGSQIKNHSIPANKLTASAVSALRGVGGASNSSNNSDSCAVNTTTPSTWCGKPATVKFRKKTAVLVTGSVDQASNDGNKIQGELGICYATHGSASLVSVQHVYPEFVAPEDSYFAQATTGFVKGLAAGTYDVGLCVRNQSANSSNGNFNNSYLTVQTP